jgi:hypothetical protein
MQSFRGPQVSVYLENLPTAPYLDVIEKLQLKIVS